jgi:hypothetical protein
MKQYKLLKDLPTFKAGQLAYISKTGNLIAGTPENQKTTETGLIIMIYHETTLKKFPEILTEWFEEIQEPTDSIHWKPKKDNRYYFVDSWGDVCFNFWNDRIVDDKRLALGSIYPTEEECEKAREGGLFFMTTSAKRLQYLRLAATTLANLYTMRLEKKLKNPSKKTSKIGRFILELRRKNNATRSDSRLDWCDNTYWNCRLAHSVRNCDYCNYYKNTECINTINQ